MAWVWAEPPEHAKFGAEYDYRSPIRHIDVYSNTRPSDASAGPVVYKSRSKLERFSKFHCPPFELDQVVDKLWQDIILRFVPRDRVQFYPVRLIARGAECDDYTLVIPFDRVRCIDVARSKITNKVEKVGLTLIFDCDEYFHLDNCMQGKHLARDEQQLSHVVVSDELRDALAATGESGMFYRPEDVPTLYGKNGLRARGLM